ncbi:Zn-dependent oligopeptidase [Myxococcota bacterium]|nr:Zn-dependent oligopeptidase [Myxococcota bacterium]MBU1511666.1 Zn-dependent oligopeptidase [Myxococcota bacterium]
MKRFMLVWLVMFTLGLVGCTEPEKKLGTVPTEAPKKEPLAKTDPSKVEVVAAPKIVLEPTLWATAEAAAEDCSKNLELVKTIRGEIVKVAKERTVENTLVPYARLRLALDRVIPMTDLMKEVHPDAGVRAAAEKCEVEAKKVFSELKLDRELFQAINAVAGIPAADKLTLRFRDNLLREYRLAGVDKDDAARAKLKQLQEDAVKLGQEFAKNIRESRLEVEFTKNELAGMPDDFLKSHPANEKGIIRISTDNPDFFPVVNYARSEKTRQKIYQAYLSRAKDKNDEVLLKLLTTRHNYAVLLGYADWASYTAADKMAKDRKTIADFIDKVAALARPRMQEDLKEILVAKKKDVKGAKTVEVWDRFFYVKKIQEEKFGVDSKVVREYFEVNKVKQGLLKMTEDLFNIQFKRVIGAKAWFDGVEVYDVVENGKVFARMYLDLHPRANKYGHAAVFPIYTGVKDVQMPSAALVTNFPSGENAYMEYNDVVTFFHEFGHMIHHLFAGNHRWVTQGGINCEWDFAEVPSQLYEEWARSYPVLARFAVHPKTNMPIPEELVKKLNASAEFGKGVHVMRQMFYAALSFMFHATAPEGLGLQKLLGEMQKKYSPYPLVKGSLEYASFGHLDSYTSMYYTYMWSLVIVKDLFNQFQEKGLMDVDTALSYRQLILAPGGSVDADDMVKNFLSRPYAFDSFQKWLTTK